MSKCFMIYNQHIFGHYGKFTFNVIQEHRKISNTELHVIILVFFTTLLMSTMVNGWTVEYFVSSIKIITLSIFLKFQSKIWGEL